MARTEGAAAGADPAAGLLDVLLAHVRACQGVAPPGIWEGADERGRHAGRVSAFAEVERLLLTAQALAAPEPEPAPPPAGRPGTPTKDLLMVTVGRRSGPCNDKEAAFACARVELAAVQATVHAANAATNNAEGWYARVAPAPATEST